MSEPDASVLTPQEFADQRECLVHAMRSRGEFSETVLQAMGKVPRELFVPEKDQSLAYSDQALPIGHGQTISQPSVVAMMTTALRLKRTDRVMEIGTGSGYSAAVLGELADEVYSIERDARLAKSARERLDHLGYQNVNTMTGDGTLGWPDHAPFDAIVVAAGGPSVPEVLLRQLATEGRLVIPVGDQETVQRLVCVRKSSDREYETQEIAKVRFVPLIGVGGWGDDKKKDANG